MKVYSQVSNTIQEIFHQYTPLVEPLSLDEAFLDVTGSSRLFGDGEAIASRIKADVLGEAQLTISVGVAPCKYVAKVASDLDKPDGLVVVPQDGVIAFLKPLAVSRLWGAGKKMQETLARLGFRTIGDIQGRPCEELKRLLGIAAGSHFYNMSHGLDDRPVVSGHVAKSISHESTFGTDLVDREDCRNVLINLSDLVGRRLRKSKKSGGTVRIKVRFGDFKTLTRQISLPPTDCDFVIRKAALELFDATWDGRRGIRLLGVAVDNLLRPGDPLQGELFADEDIETSGRVLDAIDQIRDRYGSRIIRHGGSFMKSS
jgi:nucleotidyltransferase/DNA polymerase involved in DNA repair